MNNPQIAEVLENIAGLLELKGEVPFKIRAYHRAARAIEHLPQELEQMVKEGKDLEAIPGIGEAISKKIVELVTTGRLEYYERLKAEFPDGILTLMDVPGIGPKTAYRICTELGVSTIEGLEKAILEGKLASLPRLGEKTAENILRHIRSLGSKDRRIPIGKALPVAEEVIEALKGSCPSLNQISPAGSLRRFRETIGDIDLMGTSPEPEKVIDTLVHLPQVREVLAHGPKKASVLVQAGLQVDLRIVEEERFGALIQYFTGSQQHNIRLREYAQRRGLSLNEYGITVTATGQLETFADEEAFYHRLGLQFIPPELREGMWEIELAEKGALPPLVEVRDIRGDLHLHSNWSDGRDSPEDMVLAARARGYQYVAITDHSVGRGNANGLTPERLREQIRLLRRLEGQVGIKVLCGSEVDIRADGSLDYTDDLLQELDLVVAAVHSGMGQERPKMMERILKAMHNPYVHVLAHPSCRLLGQREPIELDMETLFEAARETGTALEINGSPERLDLKDTHVLRAKELGVPLVVSTDAHARTHLDWMRFGVAVARRGWCQPQHILNTRPADEFLSFFKQKGKWVRRMETVTPTR